MFQAGEFVIYGNSGVCEIKEVGVPGFSTGPSPKSYYTLSPLYSTETIYTPVDTKVLMRTVISSTEAQTLIGQLPQLQEEDFSTCNTKWLANVYESSLQDYTCESLMKLIKSICMKNCDVILSKKKLNETDLKYLKRAEDLLYNEFSVALGMEVADVKQIIEEALEELMSQKANS
jgi:CarD family transcriptional regulator